MPGWTVIYAHLLDLYRIDQVSTRRADRITSDEEERQRQGYEVITTLRLCRASRATAIYSGGVCGEPTNGYWWHLMAQPQRYGASTSDGGGGRTSRSSVSISTWHRVNGPAMSKLPKRRWTMRRTPEPSNGSSRSLRIAATCWFCAR